MWYVWFAVNGAWARLVKEYKTKGNAAKYGKKVMGDTPFVVAQECPEE